jgi:exopolysaccharide biosynthesis polyprenyl glycosylphosphotransferase
MLASALLLGDAASTMIGILAAYFLRFRTSFLERTLHVETIHVSLTEFLPFILIATLILIATFVQMNLYDARFLLRRLYSLMVILRGSMVWIIAFFCVSYAVKFDPPVSRLFVGFAYLLAILSIVLWRSVFHLVLDVSDLREQLVLRTAFVGWNRNAQRLFEFFFKSPEHPIRIVGVIPLGENAEPLPAAIPVLGSLQNLRALIEFHDLDTVILADLNVDRRKLEEIIAISDLTYTDVKVIPSVHEVFLSGLHLQTVGSVPLLGVEDLAISRFGSRVLKRCVDIVGALAGLLVSAPIIAILAVLIRRESPGPVFFRQERIGSDHVPFRMIKLRSMTLDAASQDSQCLSTRTGDPRLLRIGKLMRRWNLDELPQLWNVLRGQMSLVGPRPERTFHVERLSPAVPHYLRRHVVKPGMTGWAQVHGLRGECSLELRIQHDLYYIENWSIWMDLLIIGLTFIRWKNPSA